MAKRRPSDSDGGAEKESLSVRMRELIEIATVEERRKASDGRPSRPVDERRRRSDKSNKPEDRAA